MSKQLVAGLIALAAAWAIFGMAFGAEAVDNNHFQVSKIPVDTDIGEAFVIGFFQGSYAGVTCHPGRMSGGILLAHLRAGLQAGTVKPTDDIRTTLWTLMLSNGCTQDHPPTQSAERPNT